MASEVKKMVYTWTEIVTEGQHRIQWRAFIDDPCFQRVDDQCFNVGRIHLDIIIYSRKQIYSMNCCCVFKDKVNNECDRDEVQ